MALAATSSSAFAQVAPSGRLSLHVFAPLGSFTPQRNQPCETNLVGLGETSIPLCDAYRVFATNSGAAPVEGPIVLRDQLPPGLFVARLDSLRFTNRLAPEGFFGEEAAEILPVEEHCEKQTVAEVTTVTCTYSGNLGPDGELQMIVPVIVEAAATAGAPNTVTVTGTTIVPEEAPPEAQAVQPLELGSTPLAFGPSALLSQITSADAYPESQAGAHPYEMSTRIDLDSTIRQSPESLTRITSAGTLRDVVVDLPPGLIGSALAAPRCTFHQLVSTSHCPPDTRVGRIVTDPEAIASVNSPVFNMAPEQGVAAELGFFDALHNAHTINVGLAPTPAGYVLRAASSEIPATQFTDIIATLFGDPAARDEQGNTPVAMFTNPSACSGQPLQSTLYIDSWETPGARSADGSPDPEGPGWVKGVSAAAESPPVSGCNLLRFAPESLTARPDTTSADSPTGLDFDLKIPQPEDPGTLATPPLRKASVTLPAGLAVNPSAANGLQACSEGQIGYEGFNPATQVQEFNSEPPACPDAAKIGSVEVATPALEGRLQGAVYLAAQSQNPFHSLLAGYIVIDDPNTGVLVKIPGRLQPDPLTGQITGVFDHNPQLPFSELKIRFFGGPRGDLTTPEACGTYTTSSDLEPWSAPDSGPDATPADSFQIDSGCGGGFAPGFEAGTTTPIAGSYSPFVLKLSREDGSQRIASIDTTLPEGLLGRLAGIPYCPDAALAAAAQKTGAAEQAASSCPAASEVGSVNVGSGSGTPFYVQGRAYLAGPYRGAPLSLAIVTPAVAGPFDLGTVVVRTALYVNEETAQIHAVSDPIPHILQGIPLDIRSIALNMDKPNFTLNPTSCEAKEITGSATSTLGTVAPLRQRFQVGACGALGFKPSLKINLKGETKRNRFPALTATLTYPKGAYANVARASVALPHSEFLAQEHIKTICTRVQFGAGAGNGAECPKGSIYGKATATSPLLDKPLSGPVYLRSSSNPLPDLVVALRGQIDVALVGRIDSSNGGIRTTFAAVPDAPVSKFVLEMQGGKKGLLVNSTNLCKGTHRAISEFTGQNGKLYNTKPVLQAKCGKAKKKESRA